MRHGGPSDPRQRWALQLPGSLGSLVSFCLIVGGSASSIIAVLFFSWRSVGELSPLLNLFPVHLTGFCLLSAVRFTLVDLAIWGAVLRLTWLSFSLCDWEASWRKRIYSSYSFREKLLKIKVQCHITTGSCLIAESGVGFSVDDVVWPCGAACVSCTLEVQWYQC